MTRAKKLAEARRYVLDNSGKLGSTTTEALRLTLDLIEDFTKPRGDAPQDGTESGAQDTPASPGAALSPAPDSAAMGKELFLKCLRAFRESGPGSRSDESAGAVEGQKLAADWLAARGPAPAPAFDVEAAVLQVAAFIYKDIVRWEESSSPLRGATPLTTIERCLRRNMHLLPKPAPAVVRDDAWWDNAVRSVLAAVQRYGEVSDGVRVLKSFFGQDPAPTSAFDVEALVRRCEHECDEGGFVRVERVRAVAREMLKGGA